MQASRKILNKTIYTYYKFYSTQLLHSAIVNQSLQFKLISQFQKFLTGQIRNSMVTKKKQ